MKEKEVPQDEGIAESCSEICYAVNDDGRYVMAPSMGWEPKNIANDQAWEVIEEEVRRILGEIRRGGKSVLAFYMVKNQMDAGLLGRYAGIASWRVRLHLRPWAFRKLKAGVLDKYAKVFGVGREAFSLSVDELARIPVKDRS